MIANLADAQVVLNDQVQTITLLRERNKELEETITWALVSNGDFKPRGTNDGAYWWRTELQKRAKLKWDGEKYITKK